MIPTQYLNSLKLHEGLRLKPYTDTVGKTTIGYGRNLDDRGIFPAEAEAMLLHDAEEAWDSAAKLVRAWPALDDVRQSVLAEMVFNLGAGRFLGFKNMLAAVNDGDYYAAANQMLASLWAGQVKGRAETLAKRMRTGVW